MNKKAFTLVELIVVITIIAILGTIAFVSFQDYSSQARDTKTVSDLNNAHKKIALFKIETGFVPDPDNPVEVTSGVGNIISHQGEFGTNVKRILNYGETIVDSEWNNYKYAVNSKKSQYSVIGFLETPTAHIFSTQTFAENKGKYLFSKWDDIITLLDNNNNFVAGDIKNLKSWEQSFIGKKQLTIWWTETAFSSCKQILNLWISNTSGIHKIDINGIAVEAYCDMESDGWGWTLLWVHANTGTGASPEVFFSWTWTINNNIESYTNKATWSLPLASLTNDSFELATTIQTSSQQQGLSAQSNFWTNLTFGILKIPSHKYLDYFPDAHLAMIEPLNVKHKCSLNEEYSRVLNRIETDVNNNNAKKQFTNDDSFWTWSEDVWHWNILNNIYFRPTYTYCENDATINPGPNIQTIFWVR